MDDSGDYSQEDISEARRIIRKKQRDVLNKVHKNREDITLPDELIKQVSKLDKYLNYDIVATKEAAIDSEGFRLLSAIGREQVEAAHGNLIQFDNITFMEKLVTYMGGRRGHGSASREDMTLDWSKLGDRASVAFNRPPPTNFVFGSLDLEPVKKREQRQKRDKEVAKGEMVRPKEVQNVEDQEESTTKDVQHVMNEVQRACRERAQVGYFQFLVDPRSFAKTIENMFHFAFLVKDGRVGVDRAIKKFGITRACISPRTN